MVFILPASFGTDKKEALLATRQDALMRIHCRILAKILGSRCVRWPESWIGSRFEPVLSAMLWVTIATDALLAIVHCLNPINCGCPWLSFTAFLIHRDAYAKLLSSSSLFLPMRLDGSLLLRVYPYFKQRMDAETAPGAVWRLAFHVQSATHTRASF